MTPLPPTPPRPAPPSASSLLGTPTHGGRSPDARDTLPTVPDAGLPGPPGLLGQAPMAVGRERHHDTLPLPAAADMPAERPGPCLPGWVAGPAAGAAAVTAVWLLWQAGVLPGGGAGHVLPPHSPHTGAGPGLWSGLTVLAALAAFSLSGLTRGRPGAVWVLTRCGAYRGSVRRTGLLWISPLLRRRRIDVSLRHWRSRPIEVADSHGTPLQVSVLVVWRVRDSARAVFATADSTRHLRAAVEAGLARALSRHPADDFGGASPTLRDCDRLAEELHALIAAEVRPVGIELFSATPVRIDYGCEVAPAMRRARIAALELRERRATLDGVLTLVTETVRGVGERGGVDLDAYERKALVRDLTVALLARHDAAPAHPARS